MQNTSTNGQQYTTTELQTITGNSTRRLRRIAEVLEIDWPASGSFTPQEFETIARLAADPSAPDFRKVNKKRTVADYLLLISALIGPIVTVLSVWLAYESQQTTIQQLGREDRIRLKDDIQNFASCAIQSDLYPSNPENYRDRLKFAAMRLLLGVEQLKNTDAHKTTYEDLHKSVCRHLILVDSQVHWSDLLSEARTRTKDGTKDDSVRPAFGPKASWPKHGDHLSIDKWRLWNDFGYDPGCSACVQTAWREFLTDRFSVSGEEGWEFGNLRVHKPAMNSSGHLFGGRVHALAVFREGFRGDLATDDAASIARGLATELEQITLNQEDFEPSQRAFSRVLRGKIGSELSAIMSKSQTCLEAIENTDGTAKRKN